MSISKLPEIVAARQRMGSRIRQLRLAQGFSQAGVAAELGISPATLSLWERGLRPVNFDDLCLLASYFQITTGELIEPIDSQPELIETHP